eukprot:15328311-Ditylum_brightwellii.AAC.1
MRLPIEFIPQEIIDENNLQILAHHDFVYYPAAHTPGIWQHTHLPVTFELCVDDFGVKYMKYNHAQHLLDSLKDYPFTTE